MIVNPLQTPHSTSPLIMSKDAHSDAVKKLTRIFSGPGKRPSNSASTPGGSGQRGAPSISVTSDDDGIYFRISVSADSYSQTHYQQSRMMARLVSAVYIMLE